MMKGIEAVIEAVEFRSFVLNFTSLVVVLALPLPRMRLDVCSQRRGAIGMSGGTGIRLRVVVLGVGDGGADAVRRPARAGRTRRR